MTICFTLPYSSGGCEERRIKFDLLTAIIKCSLLAPIKARRLMLTWLALMQPRHFLFLHQLHFVTLLTARMCECVHVHFHSHWVGYGNVCLLMAHYLFCILADGKTAQNMISFFGCFVETKSACGDGQIYGEVVEFTSFPWLALSANVYIHNDTITLSDYFWSSDRNKQMLKSLNTGDLLYLATAKTCDKYINKTDTCHN